MSWVDVFQAALIFLGGAGFFGFLVGGILAFIESFKQTALDLS